MRSGPPSIICNFKMCNYLTANGPFLSNFAELVIPLGLNHFSSHNAYLQKSSIIIIMFIPLMLYNNKSSLSGAVGANAEVWPSSSFFLFLIFSLICASLHISYCFSFIFLYISSQSTFISHNYYN